jgi:hypothetical protein
MRKFLLASVAIMGSGGLSSAFAQVPAGTPTQGQTAYPLANPLASANTNNNYQAPAIPGALANPTPGTIVVHINGKVQTTFQSEWGSADTHQITATAAQAAISGNSTVAPAGSPGGPPLTVVVPAGGFAAGSTITIPTTPLQTSLGANGIGVVKLNPYALDSFMRLYFGADAMATNGLRYGAGIELRENFSGQLGSTGNTGASGYSSLSTVYVRRAFTYVAGENWGIVRFGMADGVIGIFDNGVTSGQFLINGFGGGDNQNVSGAAIPFFFLATQGAEYDNTKLVYLSPQIAGFDFGLQWAPNTSNGYGISGTNNTLNASLSGAGIGTGISCNTVANSGCPNLSSGPGIQDGTRATNQTVIGARYQGTFGGLGVLAYAAYEHSGAVHYTGLTTPAILGTTNVPGSKFNGSYQPLSFGSGGAALTFAGFTASANAIGGKLNGQGALTPSGGSNESALILGLKWTSGPLTVGATVEKGWYQGNPVLAGISQRRAQGIAAGANYVVAPGFTVFGEYMYEEIYQGANNFLTGAVGNQAGANANNLVKAQGFLLGNVINF